MDTTEGTIWVLKAYNGEEWEYETVYSDNSDTLLSEVR